MNRRHYYYMYRKGRTSPPVTYEQLRRMATEFCVSCAAAGWFQLALGKDCVDARYDVGARVLRKLGMDIWPLERGLSDVDEDQLFTALEFLYQCVAKPTRSFDHVWNGCGIHVIEADVEKGRQLFRSQVNDILRLYSPSYELRENGEIWEATPSGLEDTAPERTGDTSIDARVESAIRSFRRHGATEDDKRHAIRDLADVLELLKTTVGTRLPSADEDRLFEIANQFAIRHHNPRQRSEYDKGVWLDWMFHAFLNAIQLSARLVKRSGTG